MRQRERTTERYDTSQLTASNRGHLVHRDYAAHFFRWGHARRFAGGRRVLDVGCGRDCPLARVLNYPMNARPAAYVGIDVKVIDQAPGDRWVEAIGEFDFVTRWPEVAETGERFDLVACFEVIEHMAPADGAALLAGCRALLADGGILLLSTPVFDGRAAAAHIHEYTADELHGALVAAGFRIARRHGTFASYPVMKKAASASDLAMLERLREYYSDDVAACFLAPLYPDASRNCVWVCEGA